MPSAVAEQPDRDELMRKALKAHIMRERQRKKQEREAKVEEERLRKEREARERQNVMTLGETRDQLAEMEAKLVSLKEEKHQLFLQLKKVLHEDDNRRKQLHKEANDVPMPVVPGLPHQTHHLYQPINQSLQPRAQPLPQPGFKQTKRQRSPSPPPVPVSMYHQGYNYKAPAVVNPTYHSPQKTPQYCANTTHPSYYPVQDLAIFSPHYLPSREPSRGLYENSRAQVSYIEQKPMDHYALASQPSHLLHGTSIPISPAQPKNAGSITAGYPIRSQTQYQPAPAPAAAIYTTQSRPLYQSPNTPMNYTRD
ncbi:G protein pathway suppressor 2 isoform X2 [Onthophagus taurus]|uniref:G protein pathway suppressor 2 isoform X2 n=1 Tax=Onthophagus taurus TaxID=166361 RepID=UPI000C204C15|nr:G protein pathway suppressor 2 isoform X2 [Onthophagus taurus]